MQRGKPLGAGESPRFVGFILSPAPIRLSPLRESHKITVTTKSSWEKRKRTENLYLSCTAIFWRHFFCDLYKFAQLLQRGNLYGRATQQTLTQSREFLPPLSVPPLQTPSLSPLPLYPALHFSGMRKIAFLWKDC